MVLAGRVQHRGGAWAVRALRRMLCKTASTENSLDLDNGTRASLATRSVERLLVEGCGHIEWIATALA